ncbi:MAG TPA: hypothetical protein VII81_02985, partial [Terriglobales bacterium]
IRLWSDTVEGMQHIGAPSKRRAKDPEIPTWTCPHCGHVHSPATLRRLDNDHLQCAGCKQSFTISQSKP